MRDINIMCYGGGINSVAMLIKATKEGIFFDAILFADPGSEKKKTYAYTEFVSKWCVENGQPEIVTVRQVNEEGIFIGLYEHSLNTGSLPSIAYGHKSCSIKFKKYPQDKYLNNWSVSKDVWDKGFKVNKYIGYDADESHRTSKNFNDDKYNYHYPLVESDLGRFECVKIILDHGWPLPPKSSCTFCPSMKPFEIIELYETERVSFYNAIEMERTAKPNLTTVKGLGREWSWWDLIVAYRYINLVKRYGQAGNIPPYMKKLMAKIKRSKPKNKKTITNVTDLFSPRIEIACECYDG